MSLNTPNRKKLSEQRKAFFGTPTWPPFYCFGTPTWPPFYCFGTPIWPPWRHVTSFGQFSVLRHPNHFILYGRELQKRHHYPTIPCGPWSSKSKFFMLYWLHISTVSNLLYARELLDRLLGGLLGILSSGRNSCGRNKKLHARALCKEGEYSTSIWL